MATQVTEEKKTPQEENIDPELNDLLDRALEEMSPEEIRKRRREHRGGSNISGIGDGVEWNPSDHVWSQEFLQQASATFDSNIAQLINAVKQNPHDTTKLDQLASTFQMIAEAASQVIRPGAHPPSEKSTTRSFNDVSAAIAKTMEKMNTDTEKVQTAFTEEEVNKLFAGINMDNTPDTGSNAFVPFMQGIMQSLLSKEVLYPSIKDIVDKYPNWLRNNQSKIDKKDFERFSKQSVLMKKVCDELETERENDNEDTKKARFDKILELMQQMQELGEPPAEIAGDLSEYNSNPDMAKIDPSQCKAM